MSGDAVEPVDRQLLGQCLNVHNETSDEISDVQTHWWVYGASGSRSVVPYRTFESVEQAAGQFFNLAARHPMFATGGRWAVGVFTVAKHDMMTVATLATLGDVRSCHTGDGVGYQIQPFDRLYDTLGSSLQALYLQMLVSQHVLLRHVRSVLS